MISRKEEKPGSMCDIEISSKEDLLKRIKELEAIQLRLNNIINNLE